jgi:hypothetical protein
MHRARRVSLLAVLALAGTLALTGCRSQPDVAIYVGDRTYSQKQVDGMAKQLKAIPNFNAGNPQELVTQWIVLRDVGKKIVAEKKWPAPKVDTATLAEQTGQPAKSELVTLIAEFQAYQQALIGNVKPAAPTDADYAELHKRFVAAGLVDPSMDEQAFRKGLQGDDLDLVSTRLGLRNLYADGIKHAKVTVNPRYAPAEGIMLGDQQGHPVIVVPLNSKPGAGSAVHDRA